MNLIEFVNNRIKRLGFLDFALIKGASALVGIILGAFCSKTVKKIWPLFAALAVGISIPVVFKFFKDN